MLVLVQWTRANPTDWEPLSMTRDQDWQKLPSKPEPVGGETIDDAPGWIYAVNVQGVTVNSYDHYAVTMNGGGLDVTAWNDDPVDFPPGSRYGVVWTFLLPTLDSRIGKINTRQFLTVYDERTPSPWSGNIETSGGPVTLLPWADFTPPRANLTRHGITVSDALSEAHKAAQTTRGWREWITAG